MSIQASLADLKLQHRALELEIEDAISHPGTDDLRLAAMKRRKLQLKDEIVRLAQRTPETVH